LTYIIAEIGQNHNGDKNIAKTLIHLARDAGVTAIKLTMRDLEYEMTDEMGAQSYLSANSYGKTYMAHRQALELDKFDVADLVTYAKGISLEVVITFCSHTLLDDEFVQNEILPYIDFIKVASRDITNTLLIKRIGAHTTPIILSSGLSTFPELSLALKELYANRVTLMHCVSKYPTPIEDANLFRIKKMRDYFPEYAIGYSDHTLGYEACLLAVAMGAEMVEKHFTLDSNMRGSDHKCSIEPNYLREMVVAIYEVNSMIGDTATTVPIDSAVKKKLMRSVCSKKYIPKGSRLNLDDLCLLSPGDGISPYELNNLVGKVINTDLSAKSKIEWEMIN
jgi:sialic acid synthase